MDDYLKVDPEELQLVRDSMDKDGDAFDKEIDKMLALNEKLREECWAGEDATTWCNNFHNYLIKMKTLPQNIKQISNQVKQTGVAYTEKDYEFGDELNKEAINYVEDEPTDQEL